MNLFHFNKTNKQTNTQWVIFKISGMHCVSCSMNIDGELEDTPGVVSATTGYAKATSEVEFDPSKVSVEKIQSIVKKLGYEITPPPQS